MQKISGADLLAIRGQAAMADDYTTACRHNADRLTQAYLALQVENVRLLALIRDHVEASNNDDTAGDTFGALMEAAHNVDAVRHPETTAKRSPDSGCP